MLASYAPAHKQIQHFQNTKISVIGFSIKNSNVSVAPNRDITFNYKEQLQPIPSTSQLPSVDISVSQINSMRPDQKVNVTGTLSLGQKESKEFLVKSTQEIVFVKEFWKIQQSTLLFISGVH